MSCFKERDIMDISSNITRGSSAEVHYWIVCKQKLVFCTNKVVEGTTNLVCHIVFLWSASECHCYYDASMVL